MRQVADQCVVRAHTCRAGISRCVKPKALAGLPFFSLSLDLATNQEG